MANYFLIASFLLIPFSILSLGLIHQSHHLALIIGAVVIIGAYIKNRWVTAFFWMCAAWQIAMCLVVMKYNLPIQELAASIYFLLFLLVAGIVYIAAAHSTIKTKTFYNVICISALAQAGFCLIQHFGGVDPWLLIIRMFVKAKPLLQATDPTGTLGNPNFVAAYLAISLPFFFRGELKSRKPQWWWGAIPIAFVLIISRSSSAVIPAIMGTAFYFAGFKWFLPAMIIPIIVYILFDNPFSQVINTATEGRGEIWASAIKIIKEQPLINLMLGRGNGAPYGRAYPMHSEWLTMLYQYGLVGLAIMSGYVLTISRKNKVLFTAFIIAAINMLGNYPLHLAPSAFLIIMIAGLIERERGDDGERKR